MKILYLCHRIPYPPDKGEKIRAFHQLRALAARHEVDLFTLADVPADMAHSSTLREYCRHVTVVQLNARLARLSALPFLLTNKPLTVPYFRSAELQAKVRNAIRERSYDRIFVYCSAMAQYVESVEDIPLITDLVDVDSDKWRQYAEVTSFPFSAIYRREARCLRAYERRICEKSARVFVTTEREAALVRQLSETSRVDVIPVGVDVDSLSTPEISPQTGKPAVVFTGVMSYFPNQEAVCFFARQVLPLIRRSIPDVTFLIVGRNPGRKVQELSGIEGVEVTGYVPDVRPFLARAQVSVAPFSIAAGIQTKILEAMAAGLPVVATPKGCQGLAREVADMIEMGRTPEELAQKVVGLLENPVRARSHGMESRRRVAVAYNWDRILREMVELVENPGVAASGADITRAAARN